MDLTNQLFTELFRPTKLDGLVLPVRIYNELSKGLIQNIMLYGPAGSGKSSIARILINGFDTLKLNGSSENGIDIVRDKVVSFASTVSLEFGKEKVKVIYIDEADGFTPQAWDALRETIERYASSVRFICTCNRIDKIPAPIQSRFSCIPVYPINKEEETAVFEGYCNYVSKILTALNISYTPESVAKFISLSFPDMRTVLNTIQTLHIQGAKELTIDSLSKTFDCSDLFTLIMTSNDPVANYKFVMENYSSSPENALAEISKSFVDFLRTTYPDYAPCIPYIVITIAEYLHMMTTSSDRVVTLLACVYKLQLIISSKGQQ